MKVNIVRHPLVENSLSILRDQATGTAAFRRQSAIVSTILMVEATRELNTVAKTITTPLAPMECRILAADVVVVPVLRAGLAMLFATQDLLLDVPVGFLGLERDEQTAVAREYYQKFPGDLSGKQALVIDPMLATGGSLEDTIKALNRRGCQKITLVCIVAAPEGIEKIREKFPDVELFTAAVDERLNEQKYIVPGLGDFGDRYFGT